MPKTGRRNLLKMIGLSPALLVPWTPATEKPAPVVPPAKLSLDEALSMVDWDAMDLPKAPLAPDMTPLRMARSTSPTATLGVTGFWRPGNDGPGSGLDWDPIDGLRGSSFMEGTDDGTL